MNISDKFCLKWDYFQKNINTAIGSLREDGHFNDVTLACEDGKQIEAHTVILATSSPLFQDLLRKNKHTHPLIYMRGMKYDDLIAIVDFLYHGEANIYQENLEAFLLIAEELSLKGLTGGEHSTEDLPLKRPTKTIVALPQRQQTLKTQPSDFINTTEIKHNVSQNTVVLEGYPSSGDFLELDVKIKYLMIFSRTETRTNGHKDKVYGCQMCCKEGQQTQMRDHIEANHMEGIEIPCSLCDKIFR